jgi:hypothetical protein
MSRRNYPRTRGTSRLEAVRLIVATALAIFALGAQDIGSRGPASIDLPHRGAARLSTFASKMP